MKLMRVFVAMLTAAAALAAAADWPVFRGSPRQDGVSADKLPAQLAELWQFKTGDSIEGAPVAAGGVAYVGSYDQHLYAVTLADGKQKWKFKGGPFKNAP